MSYYRLYFMNSAGRIQRASELHCDDDAEAIRLSEEARERGAMELWSLNRLVRNFPANDPGASEPPREARAR
jgi:hypothetical protein